MVPELTRSDRAVLTKKNKSCVGNSWRRIRSISMMQPGQVKNDNEKARLAYQVILVTCPTVQTVEALGVKTGGSKTSRGAAETQRPPTTRRKKA